MIDGDFKAICRQRDIGLRYTKSRQGNQRDKLTIEYGAEKTTLHILYAFDEMDVAWMENTTHASPEFKQSILFVLDLLAKKSGVQSMEISLCQHNGYLFDHGFVPNGSLSQFKPWAFTFPDKVNGNVPIRVYGEHPLEERVRIWRRIRDTLNQINGKHGYVIRQGLGYISIHWRGSEVNKHLEIHPQLEGFRIQKGLGRTPEHVEVPDAEELLDFVAQFAMGGAAT